MLTYGNHFVGKRNVYGLNSVGTPYSGFGKLWLRNPTNNAYHSDNAIVVKYNYKGKEYSIRHHSWTASSYDVPIGAEVKFIVSGTNSASRKAFPIADTTEFDTFDYEWLLETPNTVNVYDPLTLRPLYTSGSFTMKGESHLSGISDYAYDPTVFANYDLYKDIQNNSNLRNSIGNNGGIGSIEVAPTSYEFYDGTPQLTALEENITWITPSFTLPQSTISSYYSIQNVLFKRVPYSYWLTLTGLKCSYYPTFTTSRSEFIEDYVYKSAYKFNDYYSVYNEDYIPIISSTYQWAGGSIKAGGYQGHHTGEYGNQPLYALMNGWTKDDNIEFLGKYDNFYNKSGNNTGLYTEGGGHAQINSSLYIDDKWNGKLLSNVFTLTSPLSAQQKIAAASMQSTSPANTITEFSGRLHFGRYYNDGV